MLAVGDALPVPKAWADKTLVEKLEDVLAEAGAPAPAGTSLSDFQFYQSVCASGVTDDLIEHYLALVRKLNPGVIILETAPPAVGVRTFWVMFKGQPVEPQEW